MRPPRGNGNNNQRGRGRGRGSFPGRGQSLEGSTPRGRGAHTRRGGQPGSYSNLDVIDFDIQRWSDGGTPQGQMSPQRGRPQGRPYGRGRGLGHEGRGSASGSYSGTSTPRGRWRNDTGNATPSGRGGYGSGRGTPKKNIFRADVPLSKLLAMDRPFLRPIIFVPAQQTPVLFQREEEILEVPEDFEEPADHVPTADRVARVFGYKASSDPSYFASAEDHFLIADESKPVITLDFNSIANLVTDEKGDEAITTSTAVTTAVTREILHDEASEQIQTKNDLERIFAVSRDFHIDDVGKNVQQETSTTPLPVFVLDPNPNPVAEQTPLELDLSVNPLGCTPSDQDDEVIVYIPPKRLSRRSTPSIAPSSAAPPPMSSGASEPSSFVTSSSVNIPNNSPAFNNIAFTFAPVAAALEENRQQNTPDRRRRLTKKERQVARKQEERRAMFGFYGAMQEEKQWREDTKRDQRRRDSDVEWGTDEEETSLKAAGGSDVNRLSDVLDGMELDSDIDVEAMRAFAEGMDRNGQNQVTIDDINDEELLRLEDEESCSDKTEESSEEEDDEDDDEALLAVLNAEEGKLVAEGSDDLGRIDDSDDNDDSSEDDDLPDGSFQARLDKARRNAKGKMKASSASEDSDEDDFNFDFSKADDDETFFADLQEIIDENDAILQSRDRKQRKALLKNAATYEGSEQMAPRRNNYAAHLPPELKAQWKLDRAKKAENKRLRALARLAAAADPLAQHKSGKKAMKAMLLATRADVVESLDLPNRVVDMQSLIERIRSFVFDIGGRPTMALPPMDKASRAEVHEIADAFGLKSQSKGKGDKRYTTLTRTSRTGVRINEKKISRITRSGGNYGLTRLEVRGKKGVPLPKHKEGDVVGKAAPKIGEENIGFKILSSMGWADGTSIGVSGGIDAPITAIIKHTKLGLGAAR